jgi:beta-lactamase class A
VAVSDNAATNVLIDRVGMENVNRMFKELGIEGIQLRRKMMDLQAARKGNENVATPKAMVQLLNKIYNEAVLNKELKEDFIRLFCTSKDSYIPRNLPPDVQVANKPGSLEAVRNDSGIVFAKNRPFAISVMTAYDRDERAAELAISEVALAAFHYFDMIGRSSEYGRTIPPESNPK